MNKKVLYAVGAVVLALQTALSICAGQVATLNQWREGIRKDQ
ncbi:hypothetical protein [Serratia ureilytica]|nr:hypothetical protein [Serratia ureilytica]